MTPRDLDRIEATFAAIFARLEELEHGQEDHHARIAAMEAKPSTTGPPINEAGITATFAAIFARLDELEKVAVQMAAQEIRLATLDAASKHASDYAVALSARLERLESARIAAPVAPESAETASERAEVAAALRMYRKVQACTVDADHHFVYCGDGATWKLAENLLAWLKEGEA